MARCQSPAYAGSDQRYCRNNTSSALIHTAAYAGLRWSELIGLKRKRVDLLQRKIIVAEQYLRLEDGTWVWQEPKSRSGVRAVSIPRFLAGMLEEQLHARSGPGPDGLVFPNTVGNPIIESSFLTNVWRPALRRAGIEALRFHDLRHTAVALAIAEGAHPEGHPGAHGSRVGADDPRPLRPPLPHDRRDDRRAPRRDLPAPREGRR